MERLTVNVDPVTQKAVEALAGIMLAFLKESRMLQPAPIQSEQADGLPLILQPKHVQGVLGLSKSGTYELFKQSDFPTIEIGGRKMVHRNKFFEWLSTKEINK